MIIKKLKKKHARHDIIFEETDDKNFLNINYVSKKNFSKLEHTIVSKDIDDWILYYLSNNWNIIEK